MAWEFSQTLEKEIIRENIRDIKSTSERGNIEIIEIEGVKNWVNKEQK